jgi:hypothetical protein
VVDKPIKLPGSVGQIMLELQFGNQPKEHKITEVIDYFIFPTFRMICPFSIKNSQSILCLVRAIEYVKDRTEEFDDYYHHCIKKECNLSHVCQWMKLFMFMYNSLKSNLYFDLSLD